MKTNLNHASKGNTPSLTQTQAPILQLKLGIDWHADALLVARMCDGQSPQAGQRLSLRVRYGYGDPCRTTPKTGA